MAAAAEEAVDAGQDAMTLASHAPSFSPDAPVSPFDAGVPAHFGMLHRRLRWRGGEITPLQSLVPDLASGVLPSPDARSTRVRNPCTSLVWQDS